jgi:hypothetical protein
MQTLRNSIKTKGRYSIYSYDIRTCFSLIHIRKRKNSDACSTRCDTILTSPSELSRYCGSSLLSTSHDGSRRWDSGKATYSPQPQGACAESSQGP